MDATPENRRGPVGLVQRIISEAEIADRPGQMDRLCQIAAEVDALRAEWQDMAETMWEELQERHNVDCSAMLPLVDGGGECDCLNILRVLWDEITDHADWVDDDPEPDLSPSPVEGGEE